MFMSINKFFVVTAMVMVSVMGVSSSSFLSSWWMMEINLMLMVLLMYTYQSWGESQAFKFYLSQAAASALLLLMFLNSGGSGVQDKLLVILFNFTLLFKLGAYPFHKWVLSLSGKMSWPSLGVLLSIQKVIPLYLLSLWVGSYTVWLMILSWAGLSISLVSAKSFKAIIVVSSMFFLAALIYSMGGSEWRWGVYLGFYLVMILPLIMYSGANLNKSTFFQEQFQLTAKVFVLLTVLNMMGVPPLPGFLFKLDFISFLLTQSGDPGVALYLFTFSSVAMVYVYLVLLFPFLSKQLWGVSELSEGGWGCVALVVTLGASLWLI